MRLQGMLRVGTIVVVLLVLASMADAEISAINPTRGTVGTEITILGSTFGSHKGDVLLGQENCKVLVWSDTRITCQLQKVQSPGAHVMTVFLAGPQKSEERLAYSYRYFTVLPPEVFTGELPPLDGNTVTIAGAFFGDKTGDVRLARRGNVIQIVEPKVRSWDIDKVSFELPQDLRGSFLLQVRNEVGSGYAVLELGGVVPVVLPLSLVGTTPPGEYRADAYGGANGIMFKGKFFIFPISTDYKIEARTYDTLLNKMSAADPGFPPEKTYATAKPLVVEDKLFVFTNASTFPEANYFGKLEYTSCTYNDSNGTCVWAPWQQILDLTSPEDLSPAPVFNPVIRRIEVYYNKHAWEKGYIRWVYYDLTGTSWKETGDKGDVGNLTPVGLPNGPGAVYYNDPQDGPSTLLAVKNSHEDNHGIVYLVKNGTVVRTIFDFGKFGDQVNTPSLVDLGSDTIALIYTSGADVFLRLEQSDVPTIRSMNKHTQVWSDPIEAVSMDVNDGCGYNYFNWEPTGALSCDLNSNDGLYYRKLYLFYGHYFYPNSICILGPSWKWVLLEMKQFNANLGICP